MVALTSNCSLLFCFTLRKSHDSLLKKKSLEKNLFFESLFKQSWGMNENGHIGSYVQILGTELVKMLEEV